MRTCYAAALAAALLLSGGCASITTGTTQPLTVTAKKEGADVTGAACTLVNGKGTWYVTTPGTVTVTRSFSDMAVTCKKDGMEDGLMTVKSSTKAMAFGNALIGGVIGVGVDVATGAAYDYPSSFELEMGKNVTIEARAEAKASTAAVTSGTAGASTDAPAAEKK